MLNLRAELQASIAAAIQAARGAGELPSGDAPPVLVEHPPDRAGESLGDYASPVALALGKTLRRKPLGLAEAIAKRLQKPAFVSKVDVVAPGFLNFRLNPAWLSAKVDDLIKEPELARTNHGQGTSVNLEFLSANPTGLPHVGNARGLFSADVLGRVLQHLGYAVTREYYVNDVGTQVLTYGESVLRRILQAAGFDVSYPEGLYPGDDVRVIANAVREELEEDRGHEFSPDDLANADLRAEVTRRAVVATVRAIRQLVEERAGVKYDVWFHESTLHARGAVKAVIKALKEGGHTVERDGALWLKTTGAGDDKDRVLVRRGGEVTYLASDIAYHRDKLRRGFQILAGFWGADHQGHLLPLQAGLAALGEDASRLRVLLVHLVRLVQGGEAVKIAKRAGTAVPLSELLDMIGLSAARFFLTLKPLSSPFDFDLDLARSEKEENPVYYAQYAYVRLASIIRKAKEQNLADGNLLSPDASLVTLTAPAEVRVLALAQRLPEVLEDIARTWEVQRLPQYALGLTAAIHRFYETVPVLLAGEGSLLQTRLALVVTLQRVLGTVFDLLGVERREVM